MSDIDDLYSLTNEYKRLKREVAKYKRELSELKDAISRIRAELKQTEKSLSIKSLEKLEEIADEKEKDIEFTTNMLFEQLQDVIDVIQELKTSRKQKTYQDLLKEFVEQLSDDEYDLFMKELKRETSHRATGSEIDMENAFRVGLADEAEVREYFEGLLQMGWVREYGGEYIKNLYRQEAKKTDTVAIEIYRVGKAIYPTPIRKIVSKEEYTKLLNDKNYEIKRID
ncbi:MAG: hypothetical protein QXO37_06980 [Candidatus Nitrosocaldaceae archaeon]